jgi:hypothetical protein
MVSKARTPSYFLLTGADQHRTLAAFSSAYETCRARLESKIWSLRASTPCRAEMKAGDHLVIYASGKRKFGQHFVGVAQIADAPQALRSQARDLPKQIAIASDMTVVDYLLSLKKVSIFSPPKPIGEIKDRLSIVKNPSSPKWGCYLQAGCRRITERDFLLILNSA